jgi:hypothetical protein
MRKRRLLHCSGLVAPSACTGRGVVGSSGASRGRLVEVGVRVLTEATGKENTQIRMWEHCVRRWRLLTEGGA